MAVSNSSCDVIVIGLGAMGAATVYQLAQRGARVVGIDRYSPPHTYGSSHGDSRITRLAIGEGDFYVPFALRSHEIWRELEAVTQEDLLHQVGGLVIGGAGQQTGFHGKPGFLETTIQAARRFGIRHEILGAGEIRARFPQFLVSDDATAYYEMEAGYVRPEACIRAQLAASKRYGAELRVNEEVLEIAPLQNGGVRVRTATSTLHAQQVVVSVGAWIKRLIPQYAAHFRVTRQILCWFSCGDAYPIFSKERSPVFIWAFDEATDLYGFPAIDGPQGGVKVAASAYTEEIDPERVNRVVSEDELRSIYDRCVRGKIAFLNDSCLRYATCLYTVTPDSDFVIDRSSDSPQIIVVSPCSGHGFKHSAAVGESVAELVLGIPVVRDLSRFALGRFGS
jgi:sarcosine oxidase